MILDIDLGNTFLKWRITETAQSGRCTFDGLGDVNWPAGIKRIRIASVAGSERNKQLAARLLQQLGIEAEFARTSAETSGVRNSYTDPSRMGVDRWLAIVAAWNRVKAACWVVDCGSAITVESIAADGTHLGGYIIPGMQLMSKNLLSNTAEIIVDHTLDRFDSSPGVNTSEAVQHGINLLLEALAEKVIRDAGTAPVFVTGGDGELFSSLAEGSEYCPDLVMEGLPLVLGE